MVGEHRALATGRHLPLWRRVHEHAAAGARKTRGAGDALVLGASSRRDARGAAGLVALADGRLGGGDGVSAGRRLRLGDGDPEPDAKRRLPRRQMTSPMSAARLKRAVWLKAESVGGVESAVTSALRVVARETTAQYGAAINDAIPSSAEEAWLTPFLRALRGAKEDTGESPDWGRLLWLHPVHTVTVPERSALLATAQDLAPTFHGTVGLPDGVFVAGIGDGERDRGPLRARRGSRSR